MIFWLSAVLLIVSALFGGGTHAGFLGDVIVQLLAIPLLLAAGWRNVALFPGNLPRLGSPEFPLLLAVLAVLAILLLQFLPLPGGADWLLVKSVPQAADAGDLETGAWRGLSLTPSASWAAAIALLPPLALFLGLIQLDVGARMKLVILVIGLGALSLLIGFLQVAQGPESSLRFFEFTNPAEPVGFFANRNHFAAALYTTLVFAAVWFTFAARDFIRHGALETRAVLWFAVTAVLLIAVIAGLSIARSRAGIVLSCTAIAGIVAMVLMDRWASNARAGGFLSVKRLTIATLVAALMFAAQFGLQRAMTRFEVDPLGDLRFALTPATLRLAWDNLPFGAGLASFPSVYATRENTQDLFASYANRAHNDWAEFLLEGGVLAAVVMLLFLWWFASRAAAAWRPPTHKHPGEYPALQRGATIVIGLLLAHSFVDYPLRTTALSVVFAFSCAMLIAPPPRSLASHPKPAKRPGKHKTARREQASVPGERWGSDMDWPEAWKGAK